MAWPQRREGQHTSSSPRWKGGKNQHPGQLVHLVKLNTPLHWTWATQHRTFFLSLHLYAPLCFLHPSTATAVFTSFCYPSVLVSLPTSSFPHSIPFLSPMPSFPPFPPVSLTTCRSDCHGEDLMQKQYNQFPFSLLSFSFSLPHAKSPDEKQFPCRMKTKMLACANKENNERQTEMIKCVWACVPPIHTE